MIFENDNDQLMAMAAHRYCLGRSSYIVGACVVWVIDNWSGFTDNTRRVILRDTLEELIEGRVRHDCDKEDWERLAIWMWGKADKAQRENVMRQIRHKLAFEENQKRLIEILGADYDRTSDHAARAD